MEQGLQQVNQHSRLVEWGRRAEACRNSGQRVSEWCEEHGIPVSTYYSWQRKVFEAVSAKKLAANGVTNFYTGMALGVDTWAAMSVLALRERNRAVKLHCILPCEGQDITWTLPDQVRYKYILGEADSIEYVKRLYDGKCMLERNQRLVDSAGILLAVYNGEKRGGTAATVRYALKAERKIIYIVPDIRQVIEWGPAPSPAQP